MKAQVEHAGHEARNESQTPEGAPEFALLLKRLRARAGLSQEELADRARVSVQAVSALERGYRKVPYQNTVERLAEALALPPDARNRFEAAAAEARAMRFRTSRLISPTHNLPAQLTSFLGRDEVVSEIASLMERSRLVSMVGTGGVGKTRTAIEVARTLIEERTGGVWFVDLASLTDPSLIGSEIAAVLGLKEARHNPFDAALTLLAEKHVLLLLDNCEHVVEEVRAAARAMLSVCPHVTILTTSREPIALQGEHVYRIPPLAVPNDVTSAAEALRYGAVALFVDRAMAADARFLLDDENAPAVAEVCRRLDGLPLAIEIVAARSTVLSPRQLLLRLHRTFELLSGGQSPIPRQHTMRSVIDWSYGLLSAQARLLFERLSVFNGGFTLDAALDVCVGDGLEADDIFGLLASLVDKSLVVADFSQGDARYHILELTRAYAAEKLESRGQRELVARRHASAYA
ncbi:MAG: helix-turn-helix domain-containing protein, partial [Candidatus Eremiobacteraeota bacterium]|nr:helix-turn-helix domain-containing protein [Candidatus Eremiobacteraeota bacterium]